MDGLIFLLFLFFFVIPFIRKIVTNANKTSSKYKNYTAVLREQMRQAGARADHGIVRARKHKQLHSRDGADVFPEEHLEHVQKRQARDRVELLKMEANIHSKQNRAMIKVSNKSRTDWGARGDSGISSSKGLLIIIFVLVLVHLLISTFFPELLPGR